ncbi:hypothetical protein [Victivallis sp. Marseille-Q1083]|uniref:hypothetical protein n=1 Tax=Victivallis sp. Marseille-Q1083 TaxID=2717288 RepID=UPI00158C27DA|nr:hypothetical protein [Victivallis sp. Marseille-Q1083]
MTWQVTVKRKADKNSRLMPPKVRALFAELLLDLKYKGAEQPEWPNYSKLNKTKYHCHLNHHYVACWTATEETITIEVYYVGSRESAPY